jgi:flagellar biosynthesis chaperone FliJ
MKEKLREYIKKVIREVLTEMTTTGNVAGYLTPGAFSGGTEGGKKKMRKTAQQLGYTLTRKGEEAVNKADKLGESVEQYVTGLRLLSENVGTFEKQFKPHQQLGMAISEINKQLYVIEKAVIRQRRFKMKENVQTNTMWKRTMSQLFKLENRLLNIAHQLREIRN